ncbi:MAG: hypothetical protein LBC71_00815 [Oscillospiraceae bacterium]|nr:hypothetical protein [Oscillospiraceae bacterium]
MAVATGRSHTVGLKSDGTVVIASDNYFYLLLDIFLVTV